MAAYVNGNVAKYEAIAAKMWLVRKQLNGCGG